MDSERWCDYAGEIKTTFEKQREGDGLHEICHVVVHVVVMSSNGRIDTASGPAM